MEEKIFKVESYFKGKIISGEFEVINSDSFKCDIRIDHKYDFSLWLKGVENEVFSNISLFNGSVINKIDFHFTDEEKCKIYPILRKIVDKDKQEEIKILEEKLKSLKGE